MMLVLLLLSANSGWQPEPILTNERVRNTSTETSTDDGKTLDPNGEVYKQALMDRLEEHRKERYAHLTEERFEAIRQLVVEYSDTFVIDGAPCAVVKGYEFDIELEPNARPVRHQLPKMSVREMEKEQYHIKKAEAMGHLRIPTDAQKSEWSTRTHVIFKRTTKWVGGSATLGR